MAKAKAVEQLEQVTIRFAGDSGDGMQLTGDRFTSETAVLGSLVRAGAPYRRSPGQLAKSFDLTSGAMTNRLDRLEAEELIRRLPDPDDRRGVIVELTPKGRDVWQRAVGAQAAKESFVASSLDAGEQQQLNALLRRMVQTSEQAATLKE